MLVHSPRRPVTGSPASLGGTAQISSIIGNSPKWIEPYLHSVPFTQFAPPIARSRTEWACRVQRAQILLAYRANPSTYAVGEAIGVTHQTVQPCLDRAV